MLEQNKAKLAPDIEANAPAFDDRLALRNAGYLAVAFALAGSANSIVISSGSIIGHKLALDKSLATLPVSGFLFGVACGTLPAGMAVRLFGRRIAYICACLLGTLAAITAAGAIHTLSFALFSFSTFCLGFVAAFIIQFRFAAADTASPSIRPRIVSLVLLGGIFTGIVGPQALIWTKDLLPQSLFSGTFLTLSLIFVLSALLLTKIQLPARQPVDSAKTAKPLGQIILRPHFVIIAICGSASYAAMSLVMTAAPLAMIGHGHSHNAAALGIQWHVIAMFGPSFVTGDFIRRLGHPFVVFSGFMLLIASALVAIHGQSVAHHWVALIFLGFGWNFAFVGSSSWITAISKPQDAVRMQSINDFIVFALVTCSSFSAGVLLHWFDWQMVNWVLIVICAPCLLLIAQSRKFGLPR